jgi:hypothetical protein
MKKVLLSVFLVIFSVCIACLIYLLVTPKIPQEIQSVVGSEIDLCLNDMLVIGDSTGVKKQGKKIVVFTDSTQCATCRLYAIGQWRPFMESMDKRSDSIDFVFIFHPSKDNIQAVIDKVKGMELETRIYIDINGVFLKKNPRVPHSSHLQTMLLDENNIVQIVGNPIANDKMDKLYRSILDNI